MDSSTSTSFSTVATSSNIKAPKAGTIADATVTTVKKNADEKILYQSPSIIEGIVKSYFKDIPLMASIAKCESHYQQTYKGGGVYRGKVNTSDVGVMQINEKYHLKTSKMLGIDIYTLDGNMAYARYLYDREGVAPWVSSGACWDSSQTARSNPTVKTS